MNSTTANESHRSSNSPSSSSSRPNSRLSSINKSTAEPSPSHSTTVQDEEQTVDNSAQVLYKIACLYADRLLSDITLDVNGRRFPAHRLILCASSDVFQVMLMNPNWSKPHDSTIKLVEDSMAVEVFPKFLKYLYTGTITLNHTQVLAVVSLADKYNVKDLIKLCVDYMCKHIVSATKFAVLVSWLHYTLNCGHESVAKAVMDHVAWNFEIVSESEDFSSLELDVLISFLKMSSLVVEDELSLFYIVCRWLERQEAKLGGPKLAEELFTNLVQMTMSHIRFPMMSAKQIASLLIHPLVMRYRDIIIPMMSSAMAFHSQENTSDSSFLGVPGSSLGKSAISSQSSIFFTPRLYTSLKWSDTLVVEDYRNLPAYGKRSLVFSTPSTLRDPCDNRKAGRHSPSPGVMGGSTSSLSQASSGSQLQSTPLNEWTVDLYPKGVWHKKFLLICWQGTLEVPEFVQKTVRLCLSVKDLPAGPVQVGVLVSGQDEEIQYIKTVVTRRFTFTPEDPILVIDDLIPFDELNPGPYLLPTEENVSSGRRRSSCSSNASYGSHGGSCSPCPPCYSSSLYAPGSNSSGPSRRGSSTYLISDVDPATYGSTSTPAPPIPDTLKIQVIVTPVSA